MKTFKEFLSEAKGKTVIVVPEKDVIKAISTLNNKFREHGLKNVSAEHHVKRGHISINSIPYGILVDIIDYVLDEYDGKYAR